MWERGQATVEWIGLVLAVALVLGTAAARGRETAEPSNAESLGEAVAQRITCGVRGRCAVAPPAASPPRRRPARPRPAPPRRAPRTSPPQQAGLPEGMLKRTWLLCLGWRRLQYDREHPRGPRQPVPLRDTVRMVNECANPLSFLFG